MKSSELSFKEITLGPKRLARHDLRYNKYNGEIGQGRLLMLARPPTRQRAAVGAEDFLLSFTDAERDMAQALGNYLYAALAEGRGIIKAHISAVSRRRPRVSRVAIPKVKTDEKAAVPLNFRIEKVGEAESPKFVPGFYLDGTETIHYGIPSPIEQGACFYNVGPKPSFQAASNHLCGSVRVAPLDLEEAVKDPDLMKPFPNFAQRRIDLRNPDLLKSRGSATSWLEHV